MCLLTRSGYLGRRARNLIYCNKLESGVPPSRQPMFESNEYMTLIGVEPAKVPVVQQDDLTVGAACLALGEARQTRNQSLGRLWFPVVSGERPHRHAAQARAARGTPDLRPPIPEWWPHPAGQTG